MLSIATKGTYQGQWLRGLRHGYGVRTSAPFGLASSNRLAEKRMENAIPPLSQDGVVDGEIQTSTIPEVGGSGASVAGSTGGGPRKSDEVRGGFVLRAKSDEAPSRRRSLVERTGMKTFVQVQPRGILCLKVFYLRYVGNIYAYYPVYLNAKVFYV